MSDIPLVSICIPTYNRAEMVGKAIESALGQNYPNIEVLVVDNASDDAIESVVASYSDPRLTLHRNPRNLGLFGNFNRCVELSHGDYIHILHSDDYIDSGFTRRCVDFLEAHPAVAMTFTAVRAVTETDQSTIGILDQDHVYPVPAGLKQLLSTRNFINCPTVMVRKTVYDVVGPYSFEYPYSGDLYQWFRICRQSEVAFVAGVTLYYRQGIHSESHNLLFRTPLGYIDTLKILIRMMDELGDDAHQLSPEFNQAFRRHMRDCLFAGIVRSGMMKNFSGMGFIGLALSTWGMIRPVSLTDRVKKFLELVQIVLISCAIIIPGGRYCLQRLFGFSPEKY